MVQVFSRSDVDVLLPFNLKFDLNPIRAELIWNFSVLDELHMARLIVTFHP